MANSLPAVRDINHKFIVVVEVIFLLICGICEKRKKIFDKAYILVYHFRGKQRQNLSPNGYSFRQIMCILTVLRHYVDIIFRVAFATLFSFGTSGASRISAGKNPCSIPENAYKIKVLELSMFFIRRASCFKACRTAASKPARTKVRKIGGKSLPDLEKE